MEDRVLILALRGRDGQVIEQLLARRGHAALICGGVDELAQQLALGAGAALVTEESLAETDRTRLDAWLEAQPPWSDFPFVLLATRRAGRRTPAALRVLQQLGNVVVLERPINGETLGSAVDSALRGRRRQYEARRRLQDLQAAEERLTQLNESLESRIEQRTAELARANDQLMQEIAERERAQAALVQSQKMEAVGQLTGGIAHDFNNLLTVISGNLAMIQRHADDAATASRAGSALQAADRAAKLTRQLLAFSRVQRLTLTPVDINVLIAGMNDLLARTIGPQFIVDMNLDRGPLWAMADANQVELAILNLVINARDALPDGGAIGIVTEARQAADPGLAAGAYVVVRVSDQGAGIPANVLDKVFDPFFTTKPIGKGTGLGLSQVYGIAQQSGGTVLIESTEGVGTRVELWLPVAAAPASHAAPDAPRQAQVKGRERVLVVEDEPGVRRFIVECLEMLGYAVTEAAQGHEGLERLDIDRPELLIVDFAMPGMTGVEVATEARRRLPNLPIILATGYADMEAVDKVVDADHLLRKPFQIDDLERAVRGALAVRP
ncbi:MAG TPA: response regulator [Caulobacteraceae bacterium]|nr:response regulator [Caulobacteraceae bacterium]